MDSAERIMQDVKATMSPRERTRIGLCVGVLDEVCRTHGEAAALAIIWYAAQLTEQRTAEPAPEETEGTDYV